MLGESAIAVRTKAMKCLSEVVAVDPSILARVSVLINFNRGFCSSVVELPGNYPNLTTFRLAAIMFSNVHLCLTNLPCLFFSWICSVGFIVA